MNEPRTSLADRILLLGKRFGYARPALNSIHLLYWFLGEFYYSKIFDWRFTSCWITINLICIVLLFTQLTSYMLFSPTLRLLPVLIAVDSVITGVYFMILIPFASNLYRKRTTEALKILDQNTDVILRDSFHSGSEFVRNEKSPSSLAFTILVTQFCCIASYVICTNVNMIIGYTRSKLSDPSYYLYPVYCEGVQSGYVFSALLFSQILAGSAIIVTCLIIPFFSIVTVGEFHLKFRMLGDSLTYQSELFADRYEKLQSDRCLQIGKQEKSTLQDSFVRDIHSYVKVHQNLIRGISHLKPYLEFNMSISIIMFLFFEITLLYTFVLPQNLDSIMPRIRSLNYAVIICAIFYVNCLAGKLFSDMEETFRDSVYNIPWYYLSPENRKLYHLLLYRAHTKIQFRALSIYSMNMELFLKFWQHVYSAVNVLRRVTVR